MCVSTSTHTRCARGRTPQRVCRQPSRSFTVPLLFHRVVVVVVVVVTATDFANSRAFFTRRRPTNTERGWAVVVDPGPWWKWKKHRCLDPAAPRINHGRTTCLLSCCHTPTTHAERIGEEVKWNGEEIWTNKFGGNRWKDSRVEKETDIGRIFERLCSFLERWRKAEEAVENRIYEEGNVKATNLFPYQCGIT